MSPGPYLSEVFPTKFWAKILLNNLFFENVSPRLLLFGVPFLEWPGNFSGPKANFKIKTRLIVAQALAHKTLNFVSSTDVFIVLFSKLLKLWSRMRTKQT